METCLAILLDGMSQVEIQAAHRTQATQAIQATQATQATQAQA